MKFIDIVTEDNDYRSLMRTDKVFSEIIQILDTEPTMETMVHVVAFLCMMLTDKNIEMLKLMTTNTVPNWNSVTTTGNLNKVTRGEVEGE